MADMLIVAISKIKLTKFQHRDSRTLNQMLGREAGSHPLTSRKHGDSCSPCGPAVSVPIAAATDYLVLYLGFSHCPNFSLFMGFHGPFSEFLLTSPDANWPILSTLLPKLLQERGSDGPFLGFMPAHPSDGAEGLGWDVRSGESKRKEMKAHELNSGTWNYFLCPQIMSFQSLSEWVQKVTEVTMGNWKEKYGFIDTLQLKIKLLLKDLLKRFKCEYFLVSCYILYHEFFCG